MGKNYKMRVFALMLLVGLFSFCDVKAQSFLEGKKHRPKVGVVLCGGGAKGFAEIGILKVIEEAGVPIDYIAGTSIGSIMGSLYAVGYDPDVMRDLVRKQDWDVVMYDRIPRKLTPVDQKMRERSYLATFPITNGKIKVKPSLVEGTYVNMLMSRLMLPAHNIHNYKDLSVPFFCIATDVEHACQYEMNKGNLARSVRASMSIPFFFKPVNIDNRLLIDGGMVNNFPVRNMQEHGADIIIGVYLEDPVIPSEEVDNSLALLENMMNLSSLAESNYGKKHCDIYIKPNLHGRNMMSFNDFDSILYFGEEAAREAYPELKHLAEELQKIEPYTVKRPHVKPVDSINVVDIQIIGLTESHKSGVVREFSKDFPKKMAIDDIEKVILKLSASGYYEDLWYEIADAKGGVTLKLHCKEREDKTVAFCIHYDNNYGIGALVNFTMKNMWNSMNRSTLNLDINIAENPYVRVNLNKRHGKYLSLGADLNFTSLRMSQYNDTKITNSYSIQDNRLDLYSQFDLSNTQLIRLGAVVDYAHMSDFVGNNGLKGDYNLFGYLYFRYFLDNQDVASFARRGWKINVLGKYVLFEGINDEGVLDNTSIQNSFIVQGNVVKSFPIGKKNSLKLGAEAGYKIGSNQVPVFYRFFVGGQSKMRYFDNIIAFTGLNFTDEIVDHIAFGKVAWQWNFYKIFYSTVNFDFGYMSNIYEDWFNSTSFVAGAGLTLGADTVIGPIELSLMGSNMNSTPVGFINVGFWF